MSEEIVARLPRLSAQFTHPPIYLWEQFYFQPVGAEIYHQAQELARRISAVSRGRKTLILSENADVIGKIGEFVTRDFFAEQLNHLLWNSFVEQVNPKGGDICDLTVVGKNIDVKCRQLHVDVTIAPSFDLRVPETEIARPMDLFILAGYCPSTRYAYVFGWCTNEELQARAVRTDIRFPAKCVPLTELHPMTSLAEYLQPADYLQSSGSPQ